VAAGDPAPSPTVRSALVRLLRDAAALDRTQSDPVVAGRNALGVAVPLLIGTAVGDAALGLTATIGAIQTAFADRPGPYRLRLLRMCGTALAAAIVSGVAALIGDNTAGSTVLVLVLALVAGLLVAAGPSAGQVGTAATAAALILGHLPQTPVGALHTGLFVLAGGLGQTVLAIAGWPLGRHRPERLALAGLYRQLAGLARHPPATGVGPPLGDALVTVRKTLYGLGHDHGPSVEAYRALLDEAEQVRGELVVLAGFRERLSEGSRDDAADAVTALLEAGAEICDELSVALAGGRPVADRVARLLKDAPRVALHRLESGDLTSRAAAVRVRSLTGHLHAAAETAQTGAAEGRAPESADEPSGAARLRDPFATLRANLDPRSDILRHALRLALLVAGSDLVGRLAGVQRGYWVPLTVLVVLRPDFATTFQRAVMRVVGTVLGLLLATVLIHAFPDGQWWHIALIAVFFFGVRFAGPGNLGLLAVSLSGLVVVLLSLAGLSPEDTVLRRGVDTVLGGALALLGVLLWPAWERGRVPERMAALVDAYHAYLDVVVDRSSTSDDLQRVRSAARRARSNAQASVDAARAEPVGGGGAVEIGQTVLVHTHRFVHAMLSIDAVRGSLLPSAGAEDVVAFLRRCGTVLTACATALRHERRLEAQPSLRGDREALADLVRENPDRFGGPGTAGTVLDSSDRIASSLDTLVAELRRQAEEPPAEAYSRTGASASDSTDGGSGMPSRRSGAGTGSP
jgi:uncharacterized membrane protein YccC